MIISIPKLASEISSNFELAIPTKKELEELKGILEMYQSPDIKSIELGRSLFFTSSYYEKIKNDYLYISIEWNDAGIVLGGFNMEDYKTDNSGFSHVKFKMYLMSIIKQTPIISYNHSWYIVRPHKLKINELSSELFSK